MVDIMNGNFRSIGHATGMRMPRSDSNQAPYAWEYWVACHLASLANKRKEKAEAAAVANGVLIDKEKNPKPAGTRELIFNSDVVGITLEVRNPSERVDPEDMAKRLIDAGVREELVWSAMNLSKKLTRPAHIFTAYLVTEEANGK